MQNKQGFTLLELLVVVLIIGILAAVALPQYKLAVDKAEFSKLNALANKLADAYQNFYMINNKFPYDFESLDIGLPEGYVKKRTYNDTAACGVMNDFYCCMVPEGGATAAITCARNDYKFGIWITTPHVHKRSFCLANKDNERANNLCEHISYSKWSGSNLLTPQGFSSGTHNYYIMNKVF